MPPAPRPAHTSIRFGAALVFILNVDGAFFQFNFDFFKMLPLLHGSSEQASGWLKERTGWYPEDGPPLGP